MQSTGVHTLAAERSGVYYGWVVLGVAAFAMVGTLPGRTQGLGLITEPLLRDLGLGRVAYAQINLVATLVGALGCFGVGRLLDRYGSRSVLTVIAHDTTLQTSESFPAGLMTVKLVLKSDIKRELVLHRVPVGTNPAEIARGAAGRPERWFKQGSLGGPAVPRDSAAEANATLNIRPGRYVLVAFEVDQAGRVRGNRDLWRDVTAIAASVLIPARFAVPDARVRLKDTSLVTFIGPSKLLQ